MPDKIDVFGCNPYAVINKDLSGIYIQFNVIARGRTLTGATHAVAMPTSRAMPLLLLLDHLQLLVHFEKSGQTMLRPRCTAAGTRGDQSG